MSLGPEQLALLTGCIVVVAFLYSSVGHAGASGYIAVMTLFGIAPDFVKPVALALNILVASVAAWQFWRAGHFSWRLLWPFMLLAIPCAFLGGYLSLPTRVFKIVVGVVLLASVPRLLLGQKEDADPTTPPVAAALGIGGVIGLLSGLTGTGGGIFLTPVLLFKGWARAKQAAACSAFFILANSTAGLLGNLGKTRHFPSFALVLAVGALAGGAAGSWLGSSRFDARRIKQFLAVVLLIAGLKLVLAG